MAKTQDELEVVEAETGSALVEINLGALLLGGGVASALLVIIGGRRKKFLWLLPITLVAAGLVILFQERQSHIEEVQSQIMEGLDTLDPVARAQVIKTIAETEISKYTPSKD